MASSGCLGWVVAVALLPNLAAAQPARQVVQTGPTGRIAVSKSGYVALIDQRSDALSFYHLASRTLIRTVPTADLVEGARLVQPVLPVWDDQTDEILLPRGGDVLAVGVDGKTKTRPYWGGRLWPIGGGGKARWIARSYGDAEVYDGSFTKLGKLANSESIVAAADGKSALLATKDGLVRFTLDPIAQTTTIATPIPPSAGMLGVRLAITANGTTAAVCLDDRKPSGQRGVVLVKDLDRKPRIVPIAWPDMIGCEVAISDLHDTLVVATVGEIRGFDLATGAQRWEAARDYGIVSGTDSAIAIHGRTLLVGWQGVQLLDVVRGDQIGRIGTEIARPEHVWFLKGDQLLTARSNSSMMGPPRVELATWSLKDGKRTRTGSADWSPRWTEVSEAGALATMRWTKGPKGSSCYVFARGTTGDGAPAGTATPKWPPRPGAGTTKCLSERAQVVDARLAHGALVVFEQGKHAVVPMSGSPVTLEESPIAATTIRLSSDARWASVGDTRGSWASLHVWDARSGKRRWFTGSAGDPERPAIGVATPRKGYHAHAFSPDSRQVAVAGTDVVTVYTIEPKRAVRSFAMPSGGVATAMAFGANAMVIVGTNDGHLVVSRGGKPTIAAGDGGAITSITLRGDGRRAATVSDDGAIRIWDLAKPALLATLVEASDGEAFASTPGGAYAGGREAAAQLAWVFDGPSEGFAFERFAGQLARPDVVAKRLADATTDLKLAIVRPPRVTITRQAPPQNHRVQLGLQVSSSNGKPGSVRAFVNGRQVVSIPADTTGQDVVLEVPLEAGTNAVTIVAFDDAGRSSNPRTLDIGMPAATVRPDVWVIAAGVGWYPNLPVDDQLEGSVNDAYAIADVFAAQAGPNKRYDKAHVTVLADEQVTADALDKALAQLAQMKPSDVAVVFLAGHGVRLPKTEDMVFLTGSAKPERSTWATSGIGWTKIGGALAKARGRVIVLLDACHAGNVTQEQVVPNTQLADDLVGTQRAGVLVFAASKGSQKSLEENAARAVTLDDDQKVLVKHKRAPRQPPVPPPPSTPTAPRERRGNGYFTGAVVAALDAPGTDVNRDGVIQTGELITQVQLRVIRASRGKQTPWVARRELFGDFALAATTR